MFRKFYGRMSSASYIGALAKYPREKASHPQWGAAGHELWATFEGSRDEAKFLTAVRVR